MSTRARILEVAVGLVAQSPDGDVSTRAVCEAAQVGAPALYRHFGDKEGLLAAVVDHGFGAYLATKRQRGPTADPIEDLRNGWDSHTDFALRNRNLYRLMNSPAMRTPPDSALESHRILERDLGRAAAQGKLRLAPELAAQMVMSANVGVALMLVSRPATFTDHSISRRVRDALHTAIFTPEVIAGLSDTASRGPADTTDEVPVPATAARLRALLHQSPDTALSPAEAALLAQWLDKLANGPQRDR